jgi:hypothetical protein
VNNNITLKSVRIQEGHEDRETEIPEQPERAPDRKRNGTKRSGQPRERRQDESR